MVAPSVTRNGAVQMPASSPVPRMSRATAATSPSQSADGTSHSPIVPCQPSSIWTTCTPWAAAAGNCARTSPGVTPARKRYHEHHPSGASAHHGGSSSRSSPGLNGTSSNSAQAMRPPPGGATTVPRCIRAERNPVTPPSSTRKWSPATTSPAAAGSARYTARRHASARARVGRTSAGVVTRTTALPCQPCSITWPGCASRTTPTRSTATSCCDGLRTLQSSRVPLPCSDTDVATSTGRGALTSTIARPRVITPRRP